MIIRGMMTMVTTMMAIERPAAVVIRRSQRDLSRFSNGSSVRLGLFQFVGEGPALRDRQW